VPATSIEAISCALNEAPLPADRRDASSLAIVHVGLANQADPDGGRNAFPASATLIRYTRLSERSVRNLPREPETLDLIHPSNPHIVPAYIRHAYPRPNGYDLNLSPTSVDNSPQSVDNTGCGDEQEGHRLTLTRTRRSGLDRAMGC